ncbi:Oligopeptide/dipeptide ABC transporter, ATP-binding protein-like type [Rubellimicrobium mesophilum DSM 19309]|uniref:Oligopeptide/dipeptide ABC transporter, ATP-binding protein-like type n=1 Tax=Rubellimicrobium mesophilum DSM 19309 TaxID=442562 RepID=A0A017HR20_9RHOB|nr:ATP-binding cassette domain-containing protein [Rubellimicrobium mesophilum]EYD76578.1 Oligopeptide/dipeptide ABC transporter, ATP-binding protein-like type [Rubellimicrobium mesophilum DSM 19309]
MPDPILQTVDLGKTYGARRRFWQKPANVPPALADATLELRQGEILGVVGESGSGKTTLARCIALLERPDTGRVLFEGEDLTKLPEAALRRRRRYIQTVFQDPYSSLNPRQRIGDTLAEVMLVHGLASRGEQRDRVAALLEQVGLPATAAANFPSAFSGGQRQRICIARALAAEPKVLIADEPVSSLDVSVQAQIVNLLLDLKERLGLSVIFIGHDLQLINFIAPRVIVMLGGRIVETLPEGSSLADAKHDYTRALLQAVPTLEKLDAAYRLSQQQNMA